MDESKIVVLGPGGVGKSALTIQFVQSFFIPEYYPPVEENYKRVLQVDDDSFRLDILDTGGSDGFSPIYTSYMRQAKGFIIVYAIDDRGSFEEVEAFHRDLVRTRGTNMVPIVVCGNKCDLEAKRVVSRREGEELADRLSAAFLETSALANINVENAFREVVRSVWRDRARDAGKAADGEKGKVY
jgi:small GTP-binding protein